MRPAAGTRTGNGEGQHTLTHPTRYLELVFDNITTDGGAGIIDTGPPHQDPHAGIRLRVQSGVATQTILPAFVEAVHDGIPGVTRGAPIVSGEETSLFLDLGRSTRPD